MLCAGVPLLSLSVPLTPMAMASQEHVQQDSRTVSHQAVQELLDASKTHTGRQQLLTSGKLEDAALQAVRVFSQWKSNLLAVNFEDNQQITLQTLLLRVLRNCCALGAAAATQLLQQSVHQAVAAASAHVAGSCCTQQSGKQPDQQHASTLAVSQPAADLLTAAAQFLHNLAVTGPEGAAGVWSALFPAALESLLLVDNGRVHEAVALTCLACARSSSQTLQDLTSPAAHTTWCRLLTPLKMQHEQQEEAAEPQQQAVRTASTTPSDAGQQTCSPGIDAAAQDPTAAAAPLAVPPGNDNLCLLVKYVAMQHSKLQPLMQLLAPQQQGTRPSTAPPDAAVMPFVATEWHAVLLHVVAVEAAAVPAGSPLPGVLLEAAQSSSSVQQAAITVSSGSSADWLQYAVQLLQEVWSAVSAAAAPTQGVCSKPTADAHVLEALLHVLRAALARDEDSAKPQPKQQAEAAAAAGLAAVAQYLHHLGLVQQLLQMLTALGPPPKPKQQQQRELEQQQGQSPPPQQEPQPQHQQPYAGYRADVVAVLSNILLGGRQVQGAVMSAGGIELLLNNCNLDDTAPMAREWALWGIRNACKDNEAVQQYVSQFQAVDAVQTPELDRMGVQLELDQMTHKLKLTNKPDGQADVTVDKDE